MTRRQKLLRKLQDLQLLLVNDSHGLHLSVVKSRFVYKNTTDDEFSAIVNDFSNIIASQIAKNV